MASRADRTGTLHFKGCAMFRPRIVAAPLAGRTIRITVRRPALLRHSPHQLAPATLGRELISFSHRRIFARVQTHQVCEILRHLSSALSKR